MNRMRWLFDFLTAGICSRGFGRVAVSVSAQTYNSISVTGHAINLVAACVHVTATVFENGSTQVPRGKMPYWM